MSKWNHRVMAHLEPNSDRIYLLIHEVTYSDDGVPQRYTKRAVTVGGEQLSGLKWSLNQMLTCLNKPILWTGENFPNEYNLT